MMFIKFVVPALVLLCTGTIVVAQQDDDSASYVGFHTAAVMPFARSDMTATTFQDSDETKVFLVGGCVADQVCDFTVSSECYCPEITSKCNYFTPETNLWSDCPDAPTDRYRHMAANVGGKLVLAGGRALDDSLITTVDVFDPATNTWSTPFNWVGANSDGVAFSAYGDTLFLVGGYDADYNTMATLTSVNLTTGVWDLSLPSMQHGRGDVGLGTEAGGNFYVLGGWEGTDWCNASSIVEVYNLYSNSWSEAPSMLYGRGDLAVGMMGDNLFSIAGETKDPTCTESVPVPFVARYAPGYTEWEIEQSIPADLFRFVGASYNGSLSAYSRAIYLFGGQSSYNAECSCYPVQNSTLKYIPASTVQHHSKPKLSPGGIAGVVIAVVVVVGALVLLFAVYCIAKQGYIKMDIEMTTNPSGGNKKESKSTIAANAALHHDDEEQGGANEVVDFRGSKWHTEKL